jgi:hypothetical protein
MRIFPTREQIRSELSTIKNTILRPTRMQEANAVGVVASIGFAIGLSVTGLAIASTIDDSPATPEATHQHTSSDTDAALVEGLVGLTISGAMGSLAVTSARSYKEEAAMAAFFQQTS